MARDYEPPVRDRESAPARRGSRRDSRENRADHEQWPDPALAEPPRRRPLPPTLEPPDSAGRPRGRRAPDAPPRERDPEAPAGDGRPEPRRAPERRRPAAESARRAPESGEGRRAANDAERPPSAEDPRRAPESGRSSAHARRAAAAGDTGRRPAAERRAPESGRPAAEARRAAIDGDTGRRPAADPRRAAVDGDTVRRPPAEGARRAPESGRDPVENGRRAAESARAAAEARRGSAPRRAEGEVARRSPDDVAPRRQPEPPAPRRPRPANLRKERQPGRDRRDQKPDYTADRAMGNADPAARRAKARADKRKQQGPSVLDDATRTQLEAIAREQNGLRAVWAQFRITTDDARRRNAAARTEQSHEDGFDRATAQLTDRGYAGPGGGRMNVVGRPVEYRATTAQVAGLWPWSVGAGAPLIGTPLGSHLHTGAPVCFDPMNWFLRGSFITAPSLFVLGLNGFGKSSLVRRIVLGGIAQGITPLILADVKPDYRKMVEMVGGQVIDLGYGHGQLNPLAAGVLGSVVPLLDEMPELQLQVLQDLRARQVTLIAGLVELVRGARVRDYEETLISTALRVLYRPGSGYTPDSPPIMENLLEVIVDGGEELMLDAGADDEAEYQVAIKNLRRSLRALTQGPFGAIFNGQTSVPIDTSAVAVAIDVSHIPTGDKKLKAAVMLACWADGFASVEAAHVLADAGLGPQRYFQVVMDELWQVLGLGDFMVDRVDELTRLQRTIATALIMISHTIKDLQALGSDAAIAKALGFLERARAKIFGALPAEELHRLDSTVPFTAAEQEMVTSWSAPQALTGEALKPGQQRPSPPGTGKFLLKIGEDRRPGIPFHMEFTLSEKESGIHETNQRFSEFTESTRRGDSGSAA
ncbi:hypothetical protein [Nocardia asteroides]|uniref:hypothetical protein n=1 Tax=Nocardia asteroides TaxID=1824 RepID=UPI001E452CB4|nr:hypothetical protein [Nocardia asteroides]UGT63283.1 hypothetical protein LTT61_08205 [Nocardia asteroides]